MHLPHSHLDNFFKNFGDGSDEQVEKFYQDIKLMEERCHVLLKSSKGQAISTPF